MKTNKIALSGVLLALNMIILFGATMLPGIELSLYALSSFVTAVIVVKASPKMALLFYVASALLGLAILPNKLGLLPYVLFFGYYGIVKFYIEGIRFPKLKSTHKQVLEMVMKAFVFVMAFGGGVLVFKEAFIGSVSLPDLPVAFICVAALGAFVAYDYVYTLVIPQINRIIKF